MGKCKQIDWEAIEREYRAGQLSIREIARKYKCSEAVIRKKAKANVWERDLAEKVRKRVREKMVRNGVRTSNASDKDIIEESANFGVNALLLMRGDIAKLRAVEQKLLAELSRKPTKLYMAQFQGKIISKKVGLTVSERAAAAANLAQVQHKRIALERQALNLDDDLGGAVKDIIGMLSPAARQQLSQLVGEGGE